MKLDRSIWMFGLLGISVVALGVDRVMQNIKVDQISGASGNTVTFPAGQTLKVDTIQATTAGAQPPGMVPIGGMVAVMPAVDATNAWQPPAGTPTCAIKDGFMRADGCVVPSGQGSPLQGKTLPDMAPSAGNERYLRASRATSWTTGAFTTGGANTQASNVGVFNHSSHTHGMAHKHEIGAIESPGYIQFSSAGSATSVKPASIYSSGTYLMIYDAVMSDLASGTAKRSVDWTPTTTATFYSFAPMDNSNVLKASTDSESAALSHSVTNNAVNNEPAYVEVVWVIRVK